LEIKFRKATIKDLKSIIELCNECFEEDTDYKIAKKIYSKTKNNRNNIYIVGICDNKIVAHAKITIIETIYADMGTYSILNHICVKPEYRRNGIATKMLVYVEGLCKKRNVNKLELWSMNFRIPAHGCYKKNGFILEDAGFFSKKIGE
jgi:GNAT superfamily N-acetyltransferase